MPGLTRMNPSVRPALRKSLASVLAGNPSRPDLHHLVQVSKRMALAYLHTKKRMGTLDPDRFGLSIEDMATDSIADLFAKDEEDRFVELRAYFQSTNWRKMSEVDTEIALRRIVFSKVSERLFRSFKENDPNLGKVIRNIKDVVGMEPGEGLERIGGKLWIVFGADAVLESDKPLAPSDVVEAYVTSALGKSGQTSEAVAALARFLEYHPYYRNGYPVSAFAKIVRSSFIRLGAALVDDDTPGEGYKEEEISGALEAAVDAVRTRMFDAYVATAKVDADLFDVYVRTVTDVLSSEYIHGMLSDSSHFDVLARYKPGVSKSDYRREHRNRLEYMVKMARTHFSDLLVKDYAA